MNPVIKVILVDDEIQAISNLENLLAIYPKIQILGKITQPSKAVPLIIKLDPDLVLIGIQMSEKNGFEIINELQIKAVIQRSFLSPDLTIMQLKPYGLLFLITL